MAARRPRLGAEARALLAQVAKAAGQDVWLVGGALRDAALGRESADLDLACADARGLAARLARTLKGTLVTLDEKSAVYRLVLKPSRGRRIVQIDVAGLQGKSIGEDLARRDFPINALALPLEAAAQAAPPASAFLDPRGGLKDLAAGVLRCETEQNIVDDPLRILRAFRVAAQLGLAVDEPTKKLLRKHRRLVREPAAERVSAELLGLLAVPGSSDWLGVMDECGVLTEVFEELEPGRRCAEDYYGEGGVLKHTLAVCARVDRLLTDLRKIHPKLAPDLERHFAERGGPAFRGLLMLSALLHDVAKPDTAKRIGGRLRFFEHDTKGAVMAEKILRRLRLSREQIDTAAMIVRQHLRPGHLASGGPLTERAVYRFFRDLGDDAVGLLVVCWGDHSSYMPEPRLKKLLKTATADPARSDLSRLPEDARKTMKHLQLVTFLLRRWCELERAPEPERLLDGRDVMKALKIPPGPRVGELLERVREAQAEGEVKDRESALALLARLK